MGAFMRIVWIFMATVVVAGCGSAPKPNLFILGLPAQTDRSVAQRPLIALSDISLPSYARDASIKTATSPHQIEESSRNRWATPPGEAIAAALSRALEQATGYPVVRRPLPAATRPELRLEVTMDEFYRQPDGSAVLGGQYIMTGCAEGPILRRFRFVESGSSQSFADYMRAVSAGIGRLSNDMVRDINAEGGGCVPA